MSAYTDADVPIIVPRRGVLRLRRARQALPRRAVGALLRERRPRPRRDRRRDGRAGQGARPSSPTGATPTRGPSSWRRGSPALAPGDLNRVFFTSGGGEAVESALKLCRTYHKRNGEAGRYKLIAREIAYHGTTMGALIGHRDPRPAHAVRAARPGRLPRAEHQQLPLARGPRPAVGRRRDRGEDPVRGPGDGVVRDPRAGAERRRLLHAAGRLLAARARDLRPLRRAADLGRGDLLLGPARPLVRLPSGSTTSPTSSPPPRGSPPRTRRWAP